MKSSLGAFLRQLRRSRHLSLEALSQQAAIARSTLNRWELGTHLPRLPELEAVLGALGADRQQKARALELVNAPRALVPLRQEHASAAGANAFLGHLPRGGDLLRAMRQRRGRPLFEVARALGVTTSTVSRWERSEM